MKNQAHYENVTDQTSSFDDLAYVYDITKQTAVFKQELKDFIVDEILPFELSGSGEHAWLHIQKTDENTEWVAKELARIANVRKRNVGFAGLKDRRGVTSQWFSVHLPGKPDPDWEALTSQNIKILNCVRHAKKLRRGALKENQFTIVLRNWCGDKSKFNQRCEVIKRKGVPNYFGKQRFGHAMGNLQAAIKMFTTDERIPRHLKSIYISAARSWIFNNILSKRILDGSWDQYLPGDAFMLEGKSACFKDDQSQDISQRLSDGEIHPTGVLWGVGEQLAQESVEALELEVVNQFDEFKLGLESFKVQRLRRALRVFPGNLEWGFEGDLCTLKFTLPAGSYATMVLREMVELDESNHKSVLAHNK